MMVFDSLKNHRFLRTDSCDGKRVAVSDKKTFTCPCRVERMS